MLIFLLFSRVSGCMHRSSEVTLEPPEETVTYEPPYNWSNLVRENGRLSYVVDGKCLSRQGIDVSEAQGEIDWQAVADDDIDFAIIRIGYRGTTEGKLYTDATFDANIDGAIDAGLDVGVYFYSQAINEEEAREEAKHCLYEINGRELQYPVAYDHELTENRNARADGLSEEQASANAKAFCDEIEKGGYKAMIYGNEWDNDRHGHDEQTEYPIWHSEYGSLPVLDYDFTLWQYTNQGTVAGVNSVVDMNIDLSAAAKSNS